MKLGTLLIPPSFDRAQALRLRRFALAGFVYLFSAAQVAIIWAFGVYPSSATLPPAVAAVGVNLALYLVFRSGFNLRFKDPSLTRLQMLIAITFLMYILYHMDDGRNVALFGCFFVLLFGHLSPRCARLPSDYAIHPGGLRFGHSDADSSATGSRP